MVAAQPGRVCLIPVAYGSSTAWSCVLDPSVLDAYSLTCSLAQLYSLEYSIYTPMSIIFRVAHILTCNDPNVQVPYM